MPQPDRRVTYSTAFNRRLDGKDYAAISKAFLTAQQWLPLAESSKEREANGPARSPKNTSANTSTLVSGSETQVDVFFFKSCKIS